MSKPLFEVSDVFCLDSQNSIVLVGDIQGGEINIGMLASTWVDSELYMVAEISAVEFIDGPEKNSRIGLVLDTPEQEVRELWLELCKRGDVIKIENNN